MFASFVLFYLSYISSSSLCLCIVSIHIRLFIRPPAFHYNFSISFLALHILNYIFTPLFFFKNLASIAHSFQAFLACKNLIFMLCQNFFVDYPLYLPSLIFLIGNMSSFLLHNFFLPFLYSDRSCSLSFLFHFTPFLLSSYFFLCGNIIFLMHSSSNHFFFLVSIYFPMLTSSISFSIVYHWPFADSLVHICQVASIPLPFEVDNVIITIKKDQKIENKEIHTKEIWISIQISFVSVRKFLIYKFGGGARIVLICVVFSTPFWILI